jgi:palmitoyltransferase
MLLYVDCYNYVLPKVLSCLDAIVDVVAPTLCWPWLSLPACSLIALNLFAHYFYVITVSPGFVDEASLPVDTRWQWTRPKLEVGTVRRWKVDILKAGETTCRRCERTRPEVRIATIRLGS